ncbi:MAG: ATP-binding protein [Vicinamibacteria bacterium]
MKSSDPSTVVLLKPAADVLALFDSLSGSNVIIASDLPSCLSALRDEAVFVALVDDPDRASLLATVRAIRAAHPSAKVIALTSNAAPQDVLAALKESVFAYFTRPLPADEIKDAIGSALGQPDWEDGIELLSAKPEWVALRLRCKRATADRVLGFLRHLHLDLSDEDRETFGEAVKEILLNAIEHGGGLDPDKRVEIARIRTARMILYAISDPGIGFSFANLPHSALSNDPLDPTAHMRVREERGLRPGGYGILLTQTRVDEIVYNEAGNQVVMIRYLADKSVPTSGEAA